MCKYKVLIDYYTEGFRFEDEGFETVDDAVHHGSNNTSYPFLIVKVIDWKAEGIGEFVKPIEGKKYIEQMAG